MPDINLTIDPNRRAAAREAHDRVLADGGSQADAFAAAADAYEAPAQQPEPEEGAASDLAGPANPYKKPGDPSLAEFAAYSIAEQNAVEAANGGVTERVLAARAWDEEAPQRSASWPRPRTPTSSGGRAPSSRSGPSSSAPFGESSYRATTSRSFSAGKTLASAPGVTPAGARR